MNCNYTKERFVEDEDGDMVKEVYEPINDEWMSEDAYKLNKTILEESMDDAERYWDEHGSF